MNYKAYLKKLLRLTVKQRIEVFELQSTSMLEKFWNRLEFSIVNYKTEGFPKRKLMSLYKLVETEIYVRRCNETLA